jgi:hypothetical protein
MAKYAGHGFLTTTITHHDDGSHTIKHSHEDGASHKEYAVGDLDGLHDGMEDSLRCPEEIEEELEKRGIDAEALEEAINPGLHEKMADVIKKD